MFRMEDLQAYMMRLFLEYAVSHRLVPFTDMKLMDSSVWWRMKAKIWYVLIYLKD